MFQTWYQECRGRPEGSGLGMAASTGAGKMVKMHAASSPRVGVTVPWVQKVAVKPPGEAEWPLWFSGLLAMRPG